MFTWLESRLRYGRFFPLTHVLSEESFAKAAAHLTLLPALIAELRRNQMDDVLVICGGVIPPSDYAVLREAGVAAVFGPGTRIPDAVDKVLTMLEQKQAQKK